MGENATRVNGNAVGIATGVLLVLIIRISLFHIIHITKADHVRRQNIETISTSN